MEPSQDKLDDLKKAVEDAKKLKAALEAQIAALDKIILAGKEMISTTADVHPRNDRRPV
jgi:hypothetical protein